MESIKIILVDDEPIIRKALKLELNSQPHSVACGMNDDGEIDLSVLFGEDGDEAGEEFQKGLTTVVDWNSFQEKAEQKKSENVNKAADSREAAEKTLEAMFKSSLK